MASDVADLFEEQLIVDDDPVDFGDMGGAAPASEFIAIFLFQLLTLTSFIMHCLTSYDLRYKRYKGNKFIEAILMLN